MKKFLSLALVVLIAIGALAGLAACDLFSPKEEEITELKCGITPFEPMNFKDADGEWTGFDTELSKLVGEKLGLTVTFREIDWDNRYTELAAGDINCIWNGFTANTKDKNDGIARSDKVDMSYSYMLNQQCVVIKADRADDFKVVDDLKGKKIAAEVNSAGDTFASDVVGEEEAKDIIRPKNQIATFTEVLSGAVDCSVVDILLAQSLVGKESYADLKIADIETESEVYAVGFKIGSSLRDKVNGALKELDAEGKIQPLVEKYKLENAYVLDTTFTGK